MNKFRMISFFWLVFLLAFFLGLFVYDSRIWPYKPLRQAKLFLKGAAAENLSLMAMIENDLSFRPNRYIKVAEENWTLELSEGFKTEKHKDLKGLKLNPRRVAPKIFLSEDAVKGYRLISGTFDFEQGLHGLVLLDAEGRVAHVWHISQEGLAWEHQKDTNIFPHGFEIAKDGSIVTVYDEGSSITKYDYCGNILWRLKGSFHHSIAFEGDDAIWTWGAFEVTSGFETNLLKINYQTGEILKEIPLEEVMDANPDIDIFGLLQSDTDLGSSWYPDPWHPNDIDPLPKDLEQYYPNFNAGDLLISLRSSNLIFIMDQDSLKVKWWRQGLTRRQHDPDWNNRGTITIFNNNMHRGYSNIIEINPETYQYDILVDGRKYDFYTWWRGKHQIMPDGGVLITSPDQGRVFETNKEGDLTFEFLNLYKDNNQYLVISEARFLPINYFEELPQCE